MGRFCLYSDTCLDAPCISAKLRKYSYIKDFLNNIWVGKDERYSVPINIKCLHAVQSGGVDIEDVKCINCLFCVFGCVGNRIRLSEQYRPQEFCVDITPEQIQELRDSIIPRLFRGSFIKLPRVPMSQLRVEYKSFEEFTSVKETDNIAVWGANALKFLSSNLAPRVSLEVGLLIQSRDRGGRLDISVYNTEDNYLFIAETKTTFSSMMSDGRYESQLLGYERELSAECPQNINRAKFLVVGGKESDLLPPSHPNCTGGNASSLFYKVLRDNHFFFFSANALLALGLMKMYVSTEKYTLEHLFPIMTDSKYLGVLSSGVVYYDGSIHPFEDIPYFAETEH